MINDSRKELEKIVQIQEFKLYNIINNQNNTAIDKVINDIKQTQRYYKTEINKKVNTLSSSLTDATINIL